MRILKEVDVVLNLDDALAVNMSCDLRNVVPATPGQSLEELALLYC